MVLFHQPSKATSNRVPISHPISVSVMRSGSLESSSKEKGNFPEHREINASELPFLLRRSPGKADLHRLPGNSLPHRGRLKPEVARDAATFPSPRGWSHVGEYLKEN